MTGTITSMSETQTDGMVRNDGDGTVYPFDRGSNYTVNFDMLNVGMHVNFSIVKYRDSVTAQNLTMI
jgi:hypothetical protein